MKHAGKIEDVPLIRRVAVGSVHSAVAGGDSGGTIISRVSIKNIGDAVRPGVIRKQRHAAAQPLVGLQKCPVFYILSSFSAMESEAHEIGGP